MDMSEIRLKLSEIGIDCEDMASSFMDSEQMFLKFFKKFFAAARPVLSELEKAVSAEDYSMIEQQAHALKSLSGNISLNGVYEPARQMVEDMRRQRYFTYKDEFVKLKSAYEKAECIAELIPD